jgi:hypothetical protein
MKKAFCFTALLVGIIFMTGTMAVADCPDAKMLCIKIINGKIYNNGIAQSAGEFKTGQCWKSWGCEYCYSWPDLARQCTSRFPTDCANNTCAACTPWSDVGGIAGPCYDANGKQLLAAPSTGPF